MTLARSWGLPGLLFDWYQSPSNWSSRCTSSCSANIFLRSSQNLARSALAFAWFALALKKRAIAANITPRNPKVDATHDACCQKVGGCCGACCKRISSITFSSFFKSVFGKVHSSAASRLRNRQTVRKWAERPKDQRGTSFSCTEVYKVTSTLQRDRACEVFGCTHEPHLSIPQEVA
jgi:hypothetical protein